MVIHASISSLIKFLLATNSIAASVNPGNRVAVNGILILGAAEAPRLIMLTMVLNKLVTLDVAVALATTLALASTSVFACCIPAIVCAFCKLVTLLE